MAPRYTSMAPALQQKSSHVSNKADIEDLCPYSSYSLEDGLDAENVNESDVLPARELESSEATFGAEDERTSESTWSDSLCNFCDCLQKTSLDQQGQSPDDACRYALFHADCTTCQQSVVEDIGCAFCQHLRLRHILFCLTEDPDWTSFWCHITLGTPAELLARQQAGCPLCSLLWRAPEKLMLSTITEECDKPVCLRMGLSKAVGPLQDPVEITIDLLSEGGHIEHMSPHIKAYDLTRFTEADAAQIEENATTPHPQVDWQRLRHWYNVCRTDHKECRVPQLCTPMHDFRVIDVHRWCLVQRQEPTSYLALSYVWGAPEAGGLITLLSNVEQLESEGSLHQSSTADSGIHDAVVACRELGFDYLWVDRLCIIQDDNKSKRQHIAAMHNIYDKAAFVLVQCSGTSVRSPLPGVEQTRSNAKRFLTLDSIHFSSTQIGIRATVLRSLWASRGWTYQEGALARARLYFTDQQAVYECDAGRFSEDNQENSEPWLGYDRAETCSVTRSMLSFRRAAFNTQYDLWRWHLHYYNKRRLSYDSDVYDAFTGIAQVIYGTSHALYFGLPVSEFNRALLWSADHTEELDTITARHSRTICIPSWSWASINAPIDFNRITTSYLCPLIEWYITASDGKAWRWHSLQEKQDSNRQNRRSATQERDDTDALQMRWTSFAADSPRHCLLALYSVLPRAWQLLWLSSGISVFQELKQTLNAVRHGLLPIYSDASRHTVQAGPAALGGRGLVIKSSITPHRSHDVVGSAWTCSNALRYVEVHDKSGTILGFLASNEKSPSDFCAKHGNGVVILALSLGVLDCHCSDLNDKINCIITCYGESLDDRGLINLDAQLRLNRGLNLTFWHNDNPLHPIPIVNVMAIERHGSSWKRLSVGWLLLTQWIKLNKDLTNIILV